MLYILVGDDAYAIKRRVQALMPTTAEQHCFEHTTPDDLERLLRLAESYSLRGQRSIWCRTPLLQKTVSAAVVEALQMAAQRDDTLLILSSESIDRRLKTTKALLPFATVETYPLLAEWDTRALAAQVTSLAQATGLTIDTRSRDQLVERVRNQTELLARELEKLWLWHHQTRQPVTPAIIERLVGMAAVSSIVLSKHLLARSLGSALDCLQALYAHNEPAEKIIRTLDTQYRTWTRTKALLDTNASHELIATTLKLGNPNRVYFLRRELQSVALQRRERAQTAIPAAEWSLKQGHPDALHTLVLALCA